MKIRSADCGSGFDSDSAGSGSDFADSGTGSAFCSGSAACFWTWMFPSCHFKM